MLRRYTHASFALGCFIGVGACAGLRSPSSSVTPSPPAPVRALDYAPAGAPVDLANGVRVWAAPDRGASLVHLSLRIAVGSRHETTARAGLAHLTAHALLDLRPGGGTSISQRLSAAALAYAFTTTPDATILQVTSLPDGLPAVLAVVGDLLAGDCSGLSATSFTRAQRAVLAEVRAPAESGVLAGIYGPEHPYGHAPGGTARSLAALTRTDLCAFYSGQYTPQHARLAVTGAVVPASVATAVAPLAAVPGRAGATPVGEPRWTSAGGRRSVQLHVGGPIVGLALPLPPRFDADAASGELLAVAVALRLHELQRDFAGGPLRVLRTGGALAPTLVLLAAYDGSAAAHARALALLWRAVDEAPQLVDDAALFRVVRQQRLAAAVLPFGIPDERGLQLAEYLAAPPDRGSLTFELGQIAGLNPERLTKVALAYFARAQALELHLSPPANQEALAERLPVLLPLRVDHEWRVDDEAGELAGLAALELVATPAPRRERLANGLELVLLPTGEVPVIEARLVLSVGLDHGSSEFPLAPALAPLLAAGHLATLGSPVDRGSGTRGSAIEVELGRRSTVFAIRGLASELDSLLAALQREVQFTDYSDAAEPYAEARERRRAETGSLRDLAARLAARTGAPCVDGPDFDTRAAMYPGKELRRFKNEHYRADRAMLIVTGRFDPELVRVRARQVFSAARGVETWNLPSPETPAQSPERGLLGRSREPQIVVAPGGSQVQVTFAFSISETLRAAPAALAMVEALAGQAARRVGFAASRRRVCGHDLLLIAGTAAPASAVSSLRTLLRELELLRSGAELAGPLARARRLAVRTLLTDAEQSGAIAARLTEAASDGGGALDLRSLAGQVARMSAADLRGHLADVLDPARSELLCRGPTNAAYDACNTAALTSIADPFAAAP